MSAKTSVVWKKYPKEMRARLKRRRKLIAALIKAGVLRKKSRGEVEGVASAGEAFKIRLLDGFRFVLTIRGLEQVCRANGVKVPR